MVARLHAALEAEDLSPLPVAQTGFGPYPVSRSTGSPEYNDPGMKLTTQLHLGTKLRKGGAIYPHPRLHGGHSGEFNFTLLLVLHISTVPVPRPIHLRMVK